MTRYADPRRCPDCRAAIAYGATSCAACGLSLSGPLAAELFQTLTRADELLTRIRQTAPSLVPGFGPGRTAAAPVTVGTAPAPSVRPSATAATPAPGGLAAASVPKILLGLGALCLLVAALVFLAVNWSEMGAAGRTATLLGFTTVGGLLTAFLARRGLRAATESLGTVSLGLLAFDLFGARDAGWFGDLQTPGFLILLGTVTGVAGVVATRAVRRTASSDFGGGQAIAMLGTWAAATGLATVDWLSLPGRLVLGVLAAAAVTVVVQRIRMLPVALGAGLAAGTLWLVLVLHGLGRVFSQPTARELWLELEAWPLLTAAGLAGALALVRVLPPWARVTGAAAGEVLLTLAVLVPFIDATATAFTVATLVALAVSCLLTRVVPRAWATAPAVSAALAAGWVLGVVVVLGAVGLERVGDAAGRLWTGDPAGLLPEPAMEHPAAWLLPLGTVALLGFLVVLARTFRAIDGALAPFADASVLLGLVALAVVGTVASYAVPVWLVTGLLLTTAAALVGWGVLRLAGVPLGGGTALAMFAVATGLYDEWHTAAALTVVLVLAGAVHLSWPRPVVATGAGAVGVAALGGLSWTAGVLADVSLPVTGLVGILLLAAVALGAPYLPSLWWRTDRPVTARAGLELGALLTGFALATTGVEAARAAARLDWLAGYLTALGVAVAAAALLRDDRRPLGWLGGVLLAAASWVRLADAGVGGPEAYVLPSAVALLVLGVHRLLRDGTSSTMSALTPGLSLALLPSLVWALAEPVSLRAVLLGAACLLLVLAGLRLRWTAPVLLGASAGAVLVLRHAAPFVDQAMPRWVLIGAAGAVLITVGITWERRVQEARSVVGYVRALR